MICKLTYCEYNKIIIEIIFRVLMNSYFRSNFLRWRWLHIIISRYSFSRGYSLLIQSRISEINIAFRCYLSLIIDV